MRTLFGVVLMVLLAGGASLFAEGKAVDPFKASDDPFKATDDSFDAFCRQNPTVAGPVGEKPVWVEWIVVEASSLPDQPTEEILQKARLVRQVTRLNRCAATEQWQLVDRAPDGRALAAPRRVGSALFTRLLPAEKGRVDVVFFYDLVPLSGWVNNSAGLPEVVCESQQMTTRLTFNPGQWMMFGSGGATRVTKTVDGGDVATKMERGFYMRILTEPDPSWNVQ